ncbi:S1 RNA-binding domain-containing protein [Paucibacter sp. O1-1]|nr:S1 RNA-binding domain-containing protein [Paucibacter sp. O1-1]MDA3831714.1 S1 RNA-binding domain-containing protein [Paucibacter sp. O1-1]
MTNFGVFIDLGGVDGLLHVTDISWGRINHPSDLLALDQKLNVWLFSDFDEVEKTYLSWFKKTTSSLTHGIHWQKKSRLGSKVTGSYRQCS